MTVWLYFITIPLLYQICRNWHNHPSQLYQFCNVDLKMTHVSKLPEVGTCELMSHFMTNHLHPYLDPIKIQQFYELHADIIHQFISSHLSLTYMEVSLDDGTIGK